MSRHLAKEVAETPSKVEAAKEEGVANFKRSPEYQKEILEVGWGEFAKLLVIIKGLVAQGMSLVVILSAHKSIEAVIHVM